RLVRGGPNAPRRARRGPPHRRDPPHRPAHGHRAGGRRRLGRRSLMERVCFLLKVKQDRLDEYRERHRAVWPEMLEALHESGWGNYSLFLRDDGLLVGYLETDDFEAAQ